MSGKIHEDYMREERERRSSESCGWRILEVAGIVVLLSLAFLLSAGFIRFGIHLIMTEF